MPEGDGLYPIRTVSTLTGVNPVTLRAWERRYGLVRPQRTPKGHRLYTDADIERIHRILELLQQGIPIGQARRLIDSAGAPEPAASRSHSEDPWSDFRARMTRAIERFDEDALNATYNEALSLYPVDLVSRLLVLPLLEQLRPRWAREAVGPAEAHFFSAYMRNKLGARLHHHYGIPGRGPRLMAAGLPGEACEVELLLFALAALTQGYRMVLLGANMPLAPLQPAAEKAAARAIVLFGSSDPDADTLQRALPALVAGVDCPVCVGGRVAERHGEAVRAAGAVALAGGVSQSLAQIYQALGRP
ncbi:MerR family transcriptional regulator [Spiribacter halobius]|nr:MerR family transcriptional regulator [Spiribacter halobius]UEX78413.1 MerR family transcriptional regulator [Spiribacter halobius]